MTFDKAYEEMRRGSAIALPGWRSIEYLFFSRSRNAVWAKYKDGAVRPFGFFSQPLCDALNWFVLAIESLPEIPALRPARPKGQTRQPVRMSLVDRQAEMRSRWSR